ncbi:hypothetical protein Hanom_Chr06g00574091 [Helianthus anomalus]
MKTGGRKRIYPKKFYRTEGSKTYIPKNFYTKTTYITLLSETFGGRAPLLSCARYRGVFYFSIVYLFIFRVLVAPLIVANGICWR